MNERLWRKSERRSRKWEVEITGDFRHSEFRVPRRVPAPSGTRQRSSRRSSNSGPSRPRVGAWASVVGRCTSGLTTTRRSRSVPGSAGGRGGLFFDSCPFACWTSLSVWIAAVITGSVIVLPWLVIAWTQRRHGRPGDQTVGVSGERMGRWRGRTDAPTSRRSTSQGVERLPCSIGPEHFVRAKLALVFQ